MSTKTEFNPWEMIGKSLAWLAGALLLFPVLNVAFGALGGFIVQSLVGGWVVAGASHLGLNLEASALWQVSAALAYLGSYIRVPAHAKQGGAKE